MKKILSIVCIVASINCFGMREAIQKKDMKEIKRLLVSQKVEKWHLIGLLDVALGNDIREICVRFGSLKATDLLFFHIKMAAQEGIIEVEELGWVFGKLGLHEVDLSKELRPNRLVVLRQFMREILKTDSTTKFVGRREAYKKIQSLQCIRGSKFERDKKYNKNDSQERVELLHKALGKDPKRKNFYFFESFMVEKLKYLS